MGTSKKSSIVKNYSISILYMPKSILLNMTFVEIRNVFNAFNLTETNEMFDNNKEFKIGENIFTTAPYKSTKAILQSLR